MKRWAISVSAIALGTLLSSGSASAGPIFLDGYDPDFHSTAGQPESQARLNIILNYVTGGTYNSGTTKFLFVESDLSPPGGFLVGELGLNAIGLTPGTHYDAVDAAGLALLPSFSGYSAIVVASSFGGMLTDAEIQGLVARSLEIASFINAGGGLAAFAECYPDSGFCNDNNVNGSTPLFGFVPVNVTSVATSVPYSVTAFGASLGLTNAMVNDCCTHNSFGLIGGLNVAVVDAFGTPTALAGNVRIIDDEFVPIPEPAALLLFGSGLAGLVIIRRRRKSG